MTQSYSKYDYSALYPVCRHFVFPMGLLNLGPYSLLELRVPHKKVRNCSRSQIDYLNMSQRDMLVPKIAKQD